MSRRDLEKKLREEQEATAHVFQEFLQAFQTAPLLKGKTFVRSGVLHPNKPQEENAGKGQIYNPKPLFKQERSVAIKDAIECARLVKDSKVTRGLEKRKSNLEDLKDELKLRHSQKVQEVHGEPEDPETTNLYVVNLNPTVTVNDLMELFGAYGPLASVKIMWPRADCKNRSTNCGFVAYMSRKDGEKALRELQNRENMKVRWAKWVEIPPHPVYVPPNLLKLYLPPPPSGLPFNAQPLKKNFQKPTNQQEMDALLYNSVVKVAIPRNQTLLATVHRMVEFVVREGMMFEAIIMNRELNNPLYQFLFDNKSVAHTYYRWKLYSVLQGESHKQWSTKEFRMFKGGSPWIPPVIPDYTKGMPDELIPAKPKDVTACLSESQINRLVQHIQNLTLERASVSKCMQFCLDHQTAAKDICDVVVDSFRNGTTKATKKIARLYLVNDILCNTANRVQKMNVLFKATLEQYLPEIFGKLRETWMALQRMPDKNEYKRRVHKVLKAWEIWKIFPKHLLDKLEAIFMPVIISDDDSESEGPLDGESLIKRSLKSKSDCLVETRTIDLPSCFVPSKWETVDPEQIEAQAMSTKKLYDMECNGQKEEKSLSEGDRKKLRDLEVMVLQFQEELETGKRPTRKGYSIEKEVKRYREYLLDKIAKEEARGKKHKRDRRDSKGKSRKSRK